MDPILLSNIQISKLMTKLEDFGNRSLQVRTIIEIEKEFPSGKFQVWVDVWPEFTTVLLKQTLTETLRVTYYIFSSAKENVKKLLQNTDIVKLENAVFRILPSDLFEILKDLAIERGLEFIRSENIFEVYNFNVNKMKEIPDSEDYVVGCVTPDMADQVTKEWTQQRLFEEKTLSYVSYLIRTYPSVCLRDSKGTPVAYELGQEYGGLGMLFVNPDYRKRGLGKLVTTRLMQKYIKLGYNPYVGVSPENNAAEKLHISVGFEKTGLLCGWAKAVSPTPQKKSETLN